MDFSFNSDQEELRGLTSLVLTDRCTLEHLKEIEGGEGIDASRLVDAVARGEAPPPARSYVPPPVSAQLPPPLASLLSSGGLH